MPDINLLAAAVIGSGVQFEERVDVLMRDCSLLDR
jgi:hypothetical protein